MTKKAKINIWDDGNGLDPIAKAAETLARMKREYGNVKEESEKKEPKVITKNDDTKSVHSTKNEDTTKNSHSTKSGDSTVNDSTLFGDSTNLDSTKFVHSTVKDSTLFGDSTKSVQDLLFKQKIIDNIYKDNKLTPQAKIFASYILFNIEGFECDISMNQIAKDLNFSRGTMTGVRKQIHEVFDIHANRYGTKMSFISYCTKFVQCTENEQRMLVSYSNIYNKNQNIIIGGKNVDNLNDFAKRRTFIHFLEVLLTLDKFRKFEIYSKADIYFLLSVFAKYENPQKGAEDLIAVAIYANENIKNERSSLFYLKKTIENDGFDNIQNFYKEDALFRMTFVDQLANINWEAPSLQQLIKYCRKLGVDQIGTRKVLETRLEAVAKEIKETHKKLVDMI